MNAPSLTTLLAGLLLGGASLAQTASPVAPAPAASTPAALPATDNPPPASKVPEPQVLHVDTEDDHIRIEEVRVRGQTQRLTVHPKIPGMPAYDIVPPQGGKLPQDDKTAGQRVWLKLGF